MSKFPKGFGAAPKTDSRLLPVGDERAEFYRDILMTYGPQTKRDLAMYWIEHKQLAEPKEIPNVIKATSNWVSRRVSNGELVSFGHPEDDQHGALLYGFPEVETK